MNHAEEQKSELEAISEIYYNEIKIISDKSPISFSIIVRPQASCYTEPRSVDTEGDNEGGSDDDSDQDEDEENIVPQSSVELRFDLPPDYPDVKPSIQIVSSENLEQDELETLLNNLSQKADESLGTVMIFMLVSDVVEWLSGIVEAEAQEIELEKDKKREELEAEEKRKIDGTPVTAETFLSWKTKFDAELIKQKFEQQKKQIEQTPSGAKRLTGREMFETDKALAESDLNFVDELEQEQLEALMQNIDEVDLDDVDDDDSFEPDEDEEDSIDEDSGSSDVDFNR